MKYSHRLSDAVHILTYIGASEIVEDDLSSRAIAGSINSNPSLVRRLMSTLKNAGLITSEPGRAAVSLSKPTNEITLLDVYKAIEEPDLFHVDEETNQQCPIGANIQSALQLRILKQHLTCLIWIILYTKFHLFHKFKHLLRW